MTNDGHQVDVFFPSFAVKLLDHKYITGFDDKAGAPAGTCMGFIQKYETYKATAQ